MQESLRVLSILFLGYRLVSGKVEFYPIHVYQYLTSSLYQLAATILIRTLEKDRRNGGDLDIQELTKSLLEL